MSHFGKELVRISANNNNYLHKNEFTHRFLDNKFFVEWQNKIAECARSGISTKRLSDSRFRKNILPKMTEKVNEKQKKAIEEKDNWTVSVDEWKDCSKISYYAVMLVSSESQIYIGNAPVDRGTSDNIRFGVIDIIQPYLSKIRALVTDSPNVMVKMRNDLQKDIRSVIPIRCPLHAINLITQDIANSAKIKPITDNMSRLVAYFMNSGFWAKKLREWGTSQGITTFLKLKMDTRWYTFTSMCHSVEIFKHGFHTMLALSMEQGNPDLPDDIKEIIDSSIFEDAPFLYKLTKPLMTSIGVLETNTTHLGLIWSEFINIHKSITAHHDTQINNRLPELYKNTISLLQIRFNKRAKLFDMPIYVVALYLCPQYRFITVSGKYNTLDLTKMVLQLAIAWQFTENEAVEMATGLKLYNQNLEPHYGWESDPKIYWKTITSQPALSKFAEIVFSIYASSAKVERLFSTMACTKTKRRNKLSKDTVSDLGKLKMDLRVDKVRPDRNDECIENVDEDEDDEEDRYVDEEEEEDDEDQGRESTIVEELFDLKKKLFKETEKPKARGGGTYTVQDILDRIN